MAKRLVDDTTRALNRVGAGWRDFQNTIAAPVLVAAGGPVGGLAAPVVGGINELGYRASHIGPNLIRRGFGLPPLPRLAYGEAFGVQGRTVNQLAAKRLPKLIKAKR